MKNFLVIIVLLCFLITPQRTESETFHHRGMFVTVMDAHPVLADREAISRLIADARDMDVDTLFVQIYRADQAWFPSQTTDDTAYEKAFRSVGEDPLALLIRQAHAQGMEVHAWLNMMSLSKNRKANILKKYGREILTRNTQKKRIVEDYRIDNQYFLEPGDPVVRKYLLSIVQDVLTAYPELDGIQFDYIRYPDFEPHYGYTPVNMERFKAATGLDEIDDQGPVWQQWKRDQVTELVGQLAARSRAVRPGIQVSVTGCAPFVRAYAEAFQDWQLWVNTGLVDFVTLMSYPDDVETFMRYVTEAVSLTRDPGRLNVAVPAYKMTRDSAGFKRQFDFCESADLRSCVIFHYGSLLDSPNLKNILKNF